MTEKPRFMIFSHNATYDKLHQVGTLGLTAAAMGKDVTMVVLFRTIRNLAEGRFDEVDFAPEYQGTGDEVRRLLQEKKLPRVSEMFQEARAVGDCQPVACSACLEYMGLDSEAVTKQVDSVMGLPAILELTAGAETTLFI